MVSSDLDQRVVGIYGRAGGAHVSGKSLGGGVLGIWLEQLGGTIFSAGNTRGGAYEGREKGESRVLFWPY